MNVDKAEELEARIQRLEKQTRDIHGALLFVFVLAFIALLLAFSLANDLGKIVK